MASANATRIAHPTRAYWILSASLVLGAHLEALAGPFAAVAAAQGARQRLARMGRAGAIIVRFPE